MFDDKEIKKVVSSFEKLRQAIYAVNGSRGSSNWEDMRAAEQCASRIIAAKIIASGDVT